ncbi:hypothetical protein BC829DRAFT_396046 [Chytridium lagenaria]|nr:hypothetical protein BC829DRAFT_396046 [Chytridium lagenaria]
MGMSSDPFPHVIVHFIGFYNAPVSKAIFLTVGLNSLVCSILNFKSSFHLQIFPHIASHFQILTTNLAFTSSTEILFGSLLIYHFRLLERQWGPRKYGSFALVTSAISTVLASLILFAGKSFGFSRTAAGPYGDKVFFFLWASFPGSIVSGLCGILAGSIYRSSYLPRCLCSFSRYIQPLIMSSAPIARNRDLRSTARDIANAGAAHRPAEPSEDSIATLVGLGFERDQVVTALRASGNDMDRAAAYLFDRAGR